MDFTVCAMSEYFYLWQCVYCMCWLFVCLSSEMSEYILYVFAVYVLCAHVRVSAHEAEFQKQLHSDTWSSCAQVYDPPSDPTPLRAHSDGAPGAVRRQDTFDPPQRTCIQTDSEQPCRHAHIPYSISPHIYTHYLFRLTAVAIFRCHCVNSVPAKRANKVCFI